MCVCVRACVRACVFINIYVDFMSVSQNTKKNISYIYDRTTTLSRRLTYHGSGNISIKNI